MTLGEKLREARKQAGLSQEELAIKLAVSRQAVTKWENDKGMPDVGNLKAIASLLSVSIDYLLDDGTEVSRTVIKEPIDLSAVQARRSFTKQDTVVMEKYPEATSIFRLLRKRVFSKRENIADFVMGTTIMVLTDIPLYGTFDIADQLRDTSLYYLANQKDRQYLVNVQKDFIVSQELPVPVTEKKFRVGENQFEKGIDLIARRKKRNL